MPSRGRKAKRQVPVEVRTGQLIDRLTDHALGTTELSATQLRAIELLLKTLAGLDAAAAEGEQEIVVKGALAWMPPVT